MNQYEMLGLFIALLSTIISVVALVRSREALRFAKEANQIAESQADDTQAVNSPNLTFSCVISHGNLTNISVQILNSGHHPTTILEGQVVLHSDKYPEGDQLRELAGKQIGGRAEYIVKFQPKYAFVSGEGEGVAPAELQCHVIYTRPKRENGEQSTRYKYNRGQREFVEVH